MWPASAVGQSEEVGGEAKFFRRQGEGAVGRKVLEEFEALLHLDPVATEAASGWSIEVRRATVRVPPLAGLDHQPSQQLRIRIFRP